jgi:hypothetical protein
METLFHDSSCIGGLSDDKIESSVQDYSKKYIRFFSKFDPSIYSFKLLGGGVCASAVSH